jgi:hypothetical protein
MYEIAQLIHERALKRTPFKVGSLTLIPDAFVEFRHDGNRFPVMLEHDRGTEEQCYFRRRIRAYAQLLKTRGYRELFGTNSIDLPP